MSLIIYTTKEDTWIEKVKEYAEFNSWSLSKAIRQILKAFVQVNMPEGNIYIPKEEPKYIEEFWGKSEIEIGNEIVAKLSEPKIDYITFEAQNMAKLNVNQNMEACIKEHTNNGEISCYMFDNAREYHPFCKKDCWTNKTIWKERVRL